MNPVRFIKKRILKNSKLFEEISVAFILIDIIITIIGYISLPPLILTPITISLLSLALGAYSVSISIKSDKRTERINEYMILSAIDNLQDLRYELRDNLRYNEPIDLSENIWETRDTLKRILTLEGQQQKYNKRKIKYIRLYLQQLNYVLPRINIAITPEAQKENIKHIDWIYVHITKTKGVSKKQKNEFEELRSKITNYIKTGEENP